MNRADGPATVRPTPVARPAFVHPGYDVLREIGIGSYGRVYEARQRSTGQLVAIKVLRFWDGDTRADVENQVDRFRREMRLCAELSHPNIVRLFDSGETDDGRLYAIFQHVPGSTLKDVLAQEGGLGWAETVHLMTQVLDALACAHARRVVHRDLKPENIMVTKTGARRNALVLDFGLGGFSADAGALAMPRLTATGELMGTPCYAAPEQLRGEAPTPRSDLYSWALVFCECLTGEPLVTGRSAHEIIVKQLSSDPVAIPTCVRDRRVRRLLEVAAAKDVTKRDVTIDALLQALGAAAAEPHEAAPAAVPEGERRQVTVVACTVTVSGANGIPPDIDEIDEIFHTEHARLGGIATRAGGHVAAATGGSMLLAFGYPGAHEDDARRAVRVALRIAGDVARASERLAAERGLRLELRTGIHTGLVILRAQPHGPLDMIGVTPQIATRLREIAGPGEIVASQDTQRLLRGTIECDEMGERRLPELSRGLAIYRVLYGASARDADATPFVRETPLVGRRAELRALLDLWQRTQNGRGGAVLLSGEPGMGKSRLLRELRRRVPQDGWFQIRCLDEAQDSPLRPVADAFRAIGQPLDAMLARRGFDVGATYPPLAAAFSLPPDDRWPRRALPPEREKQIVFDTLIRLVFGMASDRPVVVAFEDLHWADPTTRELVSLVIREIESGAFAERASATRLLLVATARPEFDAPWATTDVAPISLGRLGRDEVETMVNAGLANGRAVSAELLQEVVRRCDGVPLFVEELTRMLAEAGALAIPRTDPARDGGVGGGIPGSVRFMLTARLDAVSPGARSTAQLAAVVGREFRTDVLAAASPKEEDALREDLRELSDAGLVFERRTAITPSYVFRHALVRDAAYDAMTRPTRRTLHIRIATVLRERFPDVERERPDLLAQHLELGGERSTAVDYWILAGNGALSRAAYVESIRLLERGLELLERLPASRRRTQQELALTQSLGRALMLTRGFTAPEVDRMFTRAIALCEELGEELPFRVLAGLWDLTIARSDRAALSKLLVQIQRAAKDSTDPVMLLCVHGDAGAFAFYEGDFRRACEEMTAAGREYRTERFQRSVRKYGWDGGVYVLALHTLALWMLGFPSRAAALRDEMLATAQKIGNSSGVTAALCHAANVARELGDVGGAAELTERGIALATEQKLDFWLGPAFCTRGWVLVQRGRIDDGIASIRKGLGIFEAIGVRGTYAYYAATLVEAHLARRAAEDGLSVVRRLLDRPPEVLDRFYDPELQRLEGELLRVAGDDDAAAAALARALAGARRQEARSLELRVAMSQARLLRERGDAAAALAILAPVHAGFSEGHETRDLRAAATLLAELG
jgi:TOMM system kinase/cyclase fusion protein